MADRRWQRALRYFDPDGSDEYVPVEVSKRLENNLWSNISIAKLNLGNFEGAVYCAKRAIEADPKYLKGI